MTSMRHAVHALGAVLVLAGPLAAAELHVPSEHSTIQAAIDAAKPGDTVIVADGLYTGDGNRDISFGGKAITVRSANGARVRLACGVRGPYAGRSARVGVWNLLRSVAPEGVRGPLQPGEDGYCFPLSPQPGRNHAARFRLRAG